jgi:CRISPR-associated protein Csd1
LPNIGKQSLKHNNSGRDANLLWDNASFALGIGKDPAKKFDSFTATLHEWLNGVNDPALASLRKFLDRLRADAVFREQLMQDWGSDREILATGQPTVAFRFIGDNHLISDRPAVRAAYLKRFSARSSGVLGNCLLTGATNVPIQVSHPVIKNVWKTQKAGASIVSFNERAFESYSKTERKGENAPVSEEAAAAYTKALNHLLAPGSRQRMQVGDASTVFWAQSEEDRDVEDGFAGLFAHDGDDPDAQTEQVRALYESLHTGRFAGAAGDRKFFVLGLSPNAARIAIRFWQPAPLREVAAHLRRWFDELALTHGPKDPEHPTLFRLLTAVALFGKADNLPPNLGGEVMRAILSGTPYPAAWLNAAVLRCRAEQHVPYLRASVIKACLLRRYPTSPQEEPTVMLNTDNPNVAYRLGRLFATLEKIQEEASPGLNATIRERYYSAASSTPVAVFTTLLRLKNYHLAKLTNRGRAANFEKLLGEILGAVGDFPLHLNLPEQGRFALGYYHQRQAFFTKSEREARKPADHEPPPDTLPQASLI